MSTVQNGRFASVAIKYNGVSMNEYLQKFLIDFKYTDAAPGELDSITLNLDDTDGKWINEWSAVAGDVIQASIFVNHWEKQGEQLKLPCGTFAVDSADVSGPPDVVAIQATALPFGGKAAKDEVVTKAWENVKLRTVAQEIAAKSGLKLVYESSSNPTYERLDQSEQSSLAFLNETAKAEAIAVKISGSSLVLYDEEVYEKAEAIVTITRGKSNVISYSFENDTASTVYGACTVTYRPSKTKGDSSGKVITGTYKVPSLSKYPTLKVNEQVKSAAEAQRLAKNRLREKNKEAGKGSLTLSGDIRLAAGITINVAGWGKYDGKYIIESAEHAVGSGGYTTTINIRRVLGW